MGKVLTYMTTNWMTTSAGIGALITVLFKYISTKTVTIDDFMGVLIAFGLIASKDARVTGGSVQQ